MAELNAGDDGDAEDAPEMPRMLVQSSATGVRCDNRGRRRGPHASCVRCVHVR
jgi:hypothetical protein